MIVFKAFRHILNSNKWVVIGGLAIYFLIVYFITINNNDQIANQFVDAELDYGVVVETDEILATGLIDYLNQTNNVIDLTGEEESEIDNALFNGEYTAILKLEEGMEERLKSGSSEVVEMQINDRLMTSVQATQTIDKYFRFVEQVSGDESINENHITRTNDVQSNRVETNILDTGGNGESQAAFAAQRSMSAGAFIIISIILSVTTVIVRAMQNSLQKMRIGVSSLSLASYNFQLIIGMLFFGAIILLSLVAFFSILLGSKYLLFEHSITIALLILVCLCLGFLITRFTLNFYVLSALTTILSLGLSFLSGSFVPYDVMSPVMQRIAYFSPVFYYDLSLRTIQEGLSSLLMPWGIMLAFSVVFILVGLVIDKIRQVSYI